MSKVSFLKFNFNGFFYRLNVGFAWHKYEKSKNSSRK